MSNSSLASPRRVALAARCLALWVGGAGLLLPVTRAADPAWWQTRGALDASTPTPNAVVNEGQLKHFTVCAVQELNASLASAGGAGDALNQLVAGWQQDYATNNYANDPNNPTRPYKAADFNAIKVGQLKYIASLVYSRLQAVDYTSAMPWWITVNLNTDNTLAVIGQLKNVFNFDLTADSNTDGMADWWEQYYFRTLNVNPSARAARNDGLTNLQAYQQRLNPNDYYNGNTPAVTLISGDKQLGLPSATLAKPLVVAVTNADGNALINAPVAFTSVTGGGSVLGSGTSSGTTVVLTDANGSASVLYQLPNVPGAVCTVAAQAVTPNTYAASSITFTARAVTDPSIPITPSNVAAETDVKSGNVVITWTSNSDNATHFIIERLTYGHGWQQIGTCSGITTMYTDTTAGPNIVHQYRVSAAN